MPLILIISAISLMTSFMCSITEACLYSVTRSQIETLRRKGDPRGEILFKVRRKIDDAIAAILITNTVANTLGAAWAGALVRELYDSVWLGVFSAAFTASVLFFAEIVPKSLGVRFAPNLAPLLAPLLRLLVVILWPAVRICVFVTKLWNRGKKLSHGTEEDIISLASLIHGQGEIHAHEAEWVTNALRLNDVTTWDLMTPNPVVARVPFSMPLKGTAVGADHWRFSRLPVCEDEDPDAIVGVVRRRKVFDALARDEFDQNIGDLMEEAEFVSESLPAHRLLDRFLKKRRHLFCVRNEEDQFIGVVTLEDVLECLLGREIVDETDLHEDMQALAERRREALLSRRKDS